MPNLFNYDLKSSQAYILREMMERTHMECPWLDEYLAGDKEEYAEAAGMSVKTWKGCFYAVLMGATLPQNIMRSKGAVAKQLRKQFEEDDLEEAYQRLLDVIAPLYDKIERWHDLLEGFWIDTYAYSTPKGLRIKNSVGVAMDLKNPDGYWVEELRLPHVRRGKLAAFILQGREASFIFTLTQLSREYEYFVVSNQHDGLIVSGEIPEEAIQEARRRTGMHYAILDQKPFV